MTARVAKFRLELTNADASGTHLLGEWQDFYQHHATDRREGRDWTVAIPQELLVETARAQATAELAGKADFHLDTGPFISWRADPPGFDVSLSGEAVDACQCLFWEQDVDVDVDIRIELSVDHVPDGPKLVMDHRRDVSKTNPLEVICCVVTWPFDKAITLIGELPGFVVDVLTLPLRTLTGSFSNNGGSSGPPPPPNPCQDDPDDEDHKVCRYPLELNPPRNPCKPSAVTLDPERVRGFPDCLALQGTANQRELSLPVPQVSAPTPFVWKPPHVTCNGVEGEWGAVSTFQVGQGGGELILDVCGVQQVGPTGPFYRTKITSESACPQPVTADIEVRTLPGVTNGIGAPGFTLVLTNGGNVLVTVPAVPARDPDAVEQANLEGAVWRIEHCYIFRPDWPGRFDPHWLVDPPFESLVTRRLWVIRAGGLEEGERVVLFDGEEEVAAGLADRRTGVRLELLFDGDTIGIERQSAEGNARPGEQYQLNIKQVLLSEVGARTMSAPILDLAAAGTARRPRVAALTGTSLSVFGLEPDGAVDELEHLELPALDAGMTDVSGFLAMTRGGGAIRVTADGRGAARLLRGDGAPRYRVEQLAGQHVSSDGGSALNLRELDSLASKVKGRAVADRLVSGDEPAVASVRRAGGRRLIVDTGRAGYLVADAAADRSSARYRDRPWTDGLVRVGEAFARLDDDRLGFRWYRVADTLTL